MRILYLLFLLPIDCFSQKILEQSDKVYNIYRRDSSLVQSYNYEFANSLNQTDSVVNGKAVSVYVTKLYEGKPCLGDVKLFIKIEIEAKDNRARVSFSDVTYVAETDKCPQKGTLAELVKCKKCGISSDYIKNDYIKYMQSVYQEYHKFLKGKSDDGNW